MISNARIRKVMRRLSVWSYGRSAFIFTAILLLVLVSLKRYCDRAWVPDSALTRNPVSLMSMLTTSLKLVTIAGKEIIRIRKSDQIQKSSKGKTAEGADVPVTIADLTSHAILVSGLKRTFPDITIISEEHSSISNQAPSESAMSLPADLESVQDQFVDPDDIVVWVDPLDATQEYTEGLLQYVTVMVCIAVRGIPVIGIIHSPNDTSSYVGWVDRYASSNLVDARLRQRSSGQRPYRLIRSRSHPGAVDAEGRKRLGDDLHLIEAGGSGFKAIQLALGKADAYLHVTTIHKWDVCAADAVIHALGGTMTDVHGTRIDYGSNVSVDLYGGLWASFVNGSEPTGRV